MNDVSVSDVIRSPEWLPHTYNMDGRELTFVQLPRAARSEIRFLFDNHFGVKFKKENFDETSLTAAIDQAIQGQINFIFHTSFCGSTLLARALEIPGTATSLKEPAVLINLANRIIDNDNRANGARLELVLRLLERPFSEGESVISKQSNFANRLVEPILRARAESRAILLYSDLTTYLISLLKRGMWGRILGRKWFAQLVNWSKLKLDLDSDEILKLTDMQIAALAWLMQIHHFDAMAKQFGERIMVLETSQMLGAPATTMHYVSNFFDLGLTATDAENIANGPIFTKHSKFTDRNYSVEERQRDTDAVGSANSEELAMVVKWLETFAVHHGVTLKPSA